MTATFVGKSAPEVRDVLVTAAVSGVHALLLGAPGCGKTAMACAAAEAMFDQNQISIVRFNPTTSPAKVEGIVDYASLMADPPVWNVVKDGTPYDKMCKAFVADEVTRPNDAIFDLLLDVLDRLDIEPDVSPVTFGTGNFLPKGERTEALLDRFGMYYWYGDGTDPTEVAMAKMTSKNGKLVLPGSMPTPQEIKDARSATPGPLAIKAVTEYVRELSELAIGGLVIDTPNGQTKKSFGKPNNRRITTWTNILFRRSVLDTGSNDFNEVSKVAKNMIAYAWVTRTPAEAADWKMLIVSNADPVQAAIDMMMVSCFEAMTQQGQKLIAEDKRDSAAISLGMILQTNLKNLQEIIPDYKTDERYKDAAKYVQRQLSEFITGQRDAFGTV